VAPTSGVLLRWVWGARSHRLPSRRGSASISKNWSVASLWVGASGLQVGGWSWWAPVMVVGCAAPGLRLPGLVGCCGRHRLVSEARERWQAVMW
jgi:hypothetical protein